MVDLGVNSRSANMVVVVRISRIFIKVRLKYVIRDISMEFNDR